MNIAIITGSAGLVGSEACRFFHAKGFMILGIDNDMRKAFFGDNASTDWNRACIENDLSNYIHHTADIRDEKSMEKIFSCYGNDIKLIIHAAAQPSHDWAARDPIADFSINASGTLLMLEMTRRHCPSAAFIFTSTNKVYGDGPNHLPFVELKTRWEIDESHPYNGGIDENMSLDQTRHSIFGASKVAADVMVQEYGRYFEMNTVCFRGGCLTGPAHSGTELHGFLSYLMKCAKTGKQYTIFGYNGKQVRDNIHSYDLVNMFWYFYKNPRQGEVYNAGGGRHSNTSILEAITLCEECTGNKMNFVYSKTNRIGDHIWWISGINKFRQHYPEWNYTYSIDDLLRDIYNGYK